MRRHVHAQLVQAWGDCVASAWEVWQSCLGFASGLSCSLAVMGATEVVVIVVVIVVGVQQRRHSVGGATVCTASMSRTVIVTPCTVMCVPSFERRSPWRPYVRN